VHGWFAINAILRARESLPFPIFPSTVLFLPLRLFKEMELLEACQYGQMEQVHSFIKTGQNVDMADFVSGLSILGGFIRYCNYVKYRQQMNTITEWGTKLILHWTRSILSIQLSLHCSWTQSYKASDKFLIAWHRRSSWSSFGWTTFSANSL